MEAKKKHVLPYLLWKGVGNQEISRPEEAPPSCPRRAIKGKGPEKKRRG